MKNAVIAVLLAFGVSASFGVFACEGSNHSKAKTGTTPPATTAPATTTK